jgi:hypothetical protein
MAVFDLCEIIAILERDKVWVFLKKMTVPAKFDTDIITGKITKRINREQRDF